LTWGSVQGVSWGSFLSIYIFRDQRIRERVCGERESLLGTKPKLYKCCNSCLKSFAMAHARTLHLKLVLTRLDPSRRRKSVLHVCVTGLPSLLWSRSSKHFLTHSYSSLKLPLFDAALMPLFLPSMTASISLSKLHKQSLHMLAPPFTVILLKRQGVHMLAH